MSANYRQFKHGYAITAHRSQGKTVDAVIVSAGRMAGELFYVAVSRAREFLQAITSNLPLLRQTVGVDGTRQSATELVKQSEGQERRRQRHTTWGKAKLWVRSGGAGLAAESGWMIYPSILAGRKFGVFGLWAAPMACWRMPEM